MDQDTQTHRHTHAHTHAHMLQGITSFEELPENARLYVGKIEELVGVPGEVYAHVFLLFNLLAFRRFIVM